MMSHSRAKTPPPRPTTTAPAKTTLNGGAPGGLFGKMKRFVNTKIFHVDKTPDPEIEHSIAQFDEAKKSYVDLSKAAKALHKDVTNTTTHRQTMAQLMKVLARKSNPSITTASVGVLYEKNALALGNASLQSQRLEEQLATFISTMETTISKTMEDTVISIRLWEHTRTHFDTLRIELESPSISPLPAQEQDLVNRKQKLDEARVVVKVKLELLQKNLLATMEHQLVDLYCAYGKFFVDCAKTYTSDPELGSLQNRHPRANTPISHSYSGLDEGEDVTESTHHRTRESIVADNLSSNIGQNNATPSRESSTAPTSPSKHGPEYTTGFSTSGTAMVVSKGSAGGDEDKTGDVDNVFEGGTHHRRTPSEPPRVSFSVTPDAVIHGEDSAKGVLAGPSDSVHGEVIKESTVRDQGLHGTVEGLQSEDATLGELSVDVQETDQNADMCPQKSIHTRELTPPCSRLREGTVDTDANCPPGADLSGKINSDTIPGSPADADPVVDTTACIQVDTDADINSSN
ncbi:hypothetical protein SARC_00716 [Sphaeroforma arctica JP610]|uniref:AH domain-containing protein n=1 Tax=Sphaeroforma arctica JP610 TaxID=667725 RepID=A0A0L0GFY1_9EUKA|nr:hypothetical protein SARC_00716 [Sphaeroforma arctica JP610]KNC87188.1 hypothetical protein SARC_00716 [Sphaeroforma arctica JP610]|eukprot:XP_014161090.1 hypothetical protein SARC_00716 [Sphaeroforma arctica JP610]